MLNDLTGIAEQPVSFIQYIARIQFGFGAVAKLEDELDLLGVDKPMIITDAGVRAAGLLDLAIGEDARVNAAPLFDRCPREPSEEAALDALSLYRESACNGIVAIGGGAVIDLAKAVALLATHEGPLERYSADRGGSGLIENHVAPLVAIPTTAGTGSEIGRGAGIAVAGGAAKLILLSVHLVPKVALFDPALTMSAPPSVAAGAGIDALSHALEAFLSPAINPPVDAVALDSIARIAKYLPLAIQNPDMRDARWQVMMGALEGGMCFWKGLGAAHAMANPLDAYGLHHGTLVGMLLPHVLRFARAAGGPKIAALDALFGRPAEEALQELADAIGLPRDLNSLGVPQADLRAIAEESASSVFNRTTIRPGTAEDYLTMLEAVY